jgi:hypothetical protein
MKTTIENGFIVERDGDGRMVCAMLMSEVISIMRGDIVKATWALPSNQTYVRDRSGVGHTFRCDIEHVWTIINAKETT